MSTYHHPLERHVQKNLAALCQTPGIPTGTILLIMLVSGGRDSTALLYALYHVLVHGQKKPFQNKFILIAHHINHKKRGLESDLDEAFIAKECLQKEIPFYVSTLPPLPESTNFQNAARTFRREKSIEIMEEMKNLNPQIKHGFIVTAHHARDHVESVLFHMLRGAGIQGLMGLQNTDKEHLFFRPLHNLPYETLVDYQTKRNIPYREDSSNQEKNYSRNYIRHEILPKMGMVNKNFEMNFVRLSENIGEYIASHQKKEDGQLSEKKEIVLGEEINATQIYEAFKSHWPEFEKKGYLRKNFIHNLILEVRSLSGKKTKKEIPIGEEFEIVIEKREVVRLEVRKKLT